jgi:hypothetical protein
MDKFTGTLDELKEKVRQSSAEGDWAEKFVIRPLS